MLNYKIRNLYPSILPFMNSYLKVSKNHSIYFEQCGKINGKPIIVFHGGPGGGIQEYYRQFFDPNIYRIILFDQRGAGKSTPSSCLEENTTWDLVSDIEKLRNHLSIDKWIIFGVGEVP
jgi:proline iminopeptidase